MNTNRELTAPIENQQWFIQLVDDCQSIITETEFTARWALIEGYHQLGKRILEDYDKFQRLRMPDNELVQRVALSLSRSSRTIYQAIQFARLYPDLNLLPEGKNVSWHVICNKYLPKPKEQKEVPLPEGKYHTIVIDPPWPIEKIERQVRPHQHDMDYPMMTLDEIKGFPVKELAVEDGCHVYLWVTHKWLPMAFEVFGEWGVDYQCLLTWVKNVGFTPFSWMYSTEHCLFGRIGNLELLKLGVRLDFEGKVREHSRKPDEFYDIVRIVSPEPRIDIFSREKREGFDQYGNETDRFTA